ncbi:hypothetical protein GOP47_0006018 [Adiantum capillus-veneris]|uniref:Cationic amino acid transporter C-terminal domain-containing protein n=1 Tax=Adiantum capillus-veneris TaxID=13818 RepID=A0A9D4V2Y8_ADICA|nr:hypothetical protein GOP47_0006018 [Adiantum capillus-veneris]
MVQMIMEENGGGGAGSCGGSFQSVRSYMTAVMQTPTRFRIRATAVSGSEEEMPAAAAADTHVESGRGSGMMERKVGWLEVVAMGVGGMMGAGILVSTGQAAHSSAGPAVILSFAIAGFSALLSALCYSEFAVSVPSAGGAFSYLSRTLGEFAAYFTGANLLMEYVISNAMVARSFTSYLASVYGVSDSNSWRVEAHGLSSGYNMLDLPAVALIILLTICISCSTKVSCRVNLVITLFHVVLIGFMVVLGFANGSVSNLRRPDGFAPFGAKGVWNGAALVYFSYIGYDAVSTMAEEVRLPSKAMPLGIAGSLLLVTCLYCLMAASLVLLLPYTQIDTTAPFAIALREKTGWEWASIVVGIGACIGIVSSLLVAMLGQARYFCVISRAHLIPSWFAQIHPRTKTPLNASIFLGICTSVVALFTEMHILLDLIAIGTVFVFYMVANALIFRRHVQRGVTSPWPTLGFLLSISCVAIGFTTYWQKGDGKATGLAFGLAAGVVLTLVFKALVPTIQLSPEKKQWQAPFMPFLAVASIFLNVFLMGSINLAAFARFAIWSVVACIFYLVFSLHSSHDACSNMQTTSLQKSPSKLESLSMANLANLEISTNATIVPTAPRNNLAANSFSMTITSIP